MPLLFFCILSLVNTICLSGIFSQVRIKLSLSLSLSLSRVWRLELQMKGLGFRVWGLGSGSCSAKMHLSTLGQSYVL